MAAEEWTTNRKERRTGALGGKVALVTGASRGIGRAIAIELAHRSARVAINYKTSKSCAETLAEELRAFGAVCMLVQGDVSSSGEAHKVVEEVMSQWKRIDILVNNAGITRDKSLSKMGDEDWAHVINVNLNGTFYCTSAVLPVMVEQKFGRIINISSLIGQVGGFGQANYAASKGGIAAFTKALALEMAKHNITANCIAPGYTGTEMVAAMPEEVLNKICAKIPMRRLARPEEIAKAAAFLAMDGDYITGQELAINGGIAM
ncbi:MAG TPA: 3-oxoacyl-ACP reductase family protein [Candidatus Saccharimonadales bacterium]|nr:3-oxoacyl-ACP reductase family protein [Candidatus Saccharimonadales bacterium]